MTEQVPVWLDIFAAIQDELESVQNTAGGAAFEAVIAGEPQGLPLGGPYACFWYLGRTDPTNGARKTLGNVMYAARIAVQCFWPLQRERSTLGELEADIATIDTNIRREFRGNSILNSTLTDLEITDSMVAYDDLPVIGRGEFGFYRKLSFELILDNLEGEAIVA